MTPPEEAERMARAARRSQLVRVQAAGHLSAVEDAAAVADTLADLVARAS
ncbi:alpha/beta hydrolase [Cellulosimicrobium sp. CUA-896]